MVLASSGNFAVAATLVCHQLGIPCTVVFPLNTFATQLKTSTKSGATVILEGTDDATRFHWLLLFNGDDCGCICLSLLLLLLTGETFEEADARARALSSERGLVYLSAHNELATCAGYGTLGLELLQQNPYLDAVLLPVGAGSLLAATALTLKHVNPRIQVGFS